MVRRSACPKRFPQSGAADYRVPLEKIIQVSELSTSTVVYNGIAEVPEAEDPDSIAYYVSYEATVQAGIDLTAVEVQEVDHEAKTITISLPEVQLFDANVDISYAGLHISG